MLQTGATTLCEHWGCIGGSDNHIMFGGFYEWMFDGLGGINTVSNQSTTGWRVFKVKPDPAAIMVLKARAASVSSRFGVCGASWGLQASFEQLQNQLVYNLTVPAGSTVEVYFPTSLSQAGQLVLLTEHKLGPVGVLWASTWTWSGKRVKVLLTLRKALIGFTAVTTPLMTAPWWMLMVI